MKINNKGNYNSIKEVYNLLNNHKTDKDFESLNFMKDYFGSNIVFSREAKDDIKYTLENSKTKDIAELINLYANLLKLVIDTALKLMVMLETNLYDAYIIVDNISTADIEIIIDITHQPEDEDDVYNHQSFSYSLTLNDDYFVPGKPKIVKPDPSLYGKIYISGNIYKYMSDLSFEGIADMKNYFDYIIEEAKYPYGREDELY